VFLAHNSADNAAVRRIAEHLRTARIEPWLDHWNLAPGDRWQPGIVEGLRTAKACAVLIGPSGLGHWAREELAVAQDRAAKDAEFRLFMVLLPGAPDPMDASLAFLTTRTWVDLREGIADPEAFDDLIAAITGVARRPALVARNDGDVCPYRGLESFDAEHAGFYFGREGDTLRVLEKLKASRFVAVIGASGSGKSSLVRAGVVPALARGALPDSDAWSSRVFTPGARPVNMLAAQVARLFPHDSTARLVDQMREDERTLDLALSVAMADRPPEERVVAVVDQFEEIFTICSDQHERHAFLSNLLHAATIPGGRLIVLIAMRADFYHHCESDDLLRALVAAQQFMVGPLGPEDLRRVIEEPARQVGLEPEAGLVKTIISDVAGRPGTLPLLSHVLLELWRARRGGMLTLEAYVANGGVEGALAARANATYEGLSTEHREIARRVLLRLTQPGEGTEDTRRRAAMTELVTSPRENADVHSVVDSLARERLLTVGTDDVSGAETVDVTHEALIRAWPLLRSWINDDRELLRAQRRLSEAAAEWEEGGRDDALLYRGGRLGAWQGHDVSALNELERRFLAASRERERREKTAAHRRAEWAAVALSLALALISAVAVVAVRQRNRAADQRDLAYARQLAASATAQLPMDPQLSLLLALEAHRVAPIAEAEAIVRQATLESRARASLRVPDQARFADFSPDASRVVVARADGAVEVAPWDGSSPPLLLHGHEGLVRSVAYSPTGNQVASGGIDTTVRVWDLTGRSEPRVLRGHDAPIESVAYSPDGRHLASAGYDATVMVWSLDGDAPPLVLRGAQGAIDAVAFSPDGRRVAAGGADTFVRIWDLDGGEPLVIRGHHGIALGLGFSPDGKLVVSGGQDTTVRVWDATTGAEVATLQGHGTTVYGASFSPDGHEVVSASLDATVRIWDWARGGVPTILRGHAGAVFSAFFSGDGRLVVSAGADGRVQIWDVHGPGTPLTLRGHSGRAVDASFNQDGTRVATGGEDGLVRVWDLADPRTPLVLRGHEGTVFSVTFFSDGRLASAGTDGTARIWDLAHPGEPVVLHGDQGTVYDVDFSPDGRRVVTCGSDGTVRVWDLAHVEDPMVLQGHEFFVFACQFSPDGRRVVSASGDSSVRVWDLARPRSPVVLRGHRGFVFSAEFSRDGEHVVSAGEDGAVRVWDADGRTPPVVLSGHQGITLNATFRPDGQVLSSGTDGSVRVSDSAERAAPIAIRGPQANVQRAGFSRDGRWIASAGGDGSTVVWACEVCGSLDDALALARSRIVRDFTPEERLQYLHQRPRT
jgi:WD40 repeat protein